MYNIKPRPKVFHSICLLSCYVLGVILTLQTTYAQTSEGKLVFTQIIHRHGDRTPIAPYENDPWKDLKYWPTEWGQLTNWGKNQTYELGLWLRARYDGFLPREYSRNDIYIASSNSDRSIMSGECCLAGLYKPVGKDIWKSDVKWQPIPMHTIPEEYDRILQQTAPCPNYDTLLEVVMNSPTMKKIQETYKPVYSYLAKHAGQNVSNPTDVISLNNTLSIQTLYHKSLPEWTLSVFPGHDMDSLSILWFLLPTITRPMARLKGGPLLKEILDRFAQKANKTLTPDRKMWIYSAHDTTIVSLLNALKVYENEPLAYASALILELRIDNTDRTLVSLILKNGPNAVPISFPNCGYQCALSRLYKLYEDVIPENWNLECGLP